MKLLPRHFWLTALFTTLVGTVPCLGNEVARFTCEDFADRDWPRVLVDYDVSFPRGKVREGKTKLVDGEGAEHTHQLVVTKKHSDGSVQSGRVHFYASMEAGGQYDFRLHTGNAKKASSSVTATKRGDRLQVVSPLLAVELPAPMTKSFDPPVGGDKVLAPILRYRLSDGKWAGSGVLRMERLVKSLSQKVVAQGPLFHETAYRLEFAPSGYYTMRVRVERDLSLVHIAEEFDLGRADANVNQFVLDMSKGWSPSTAIWTSYRKPSTATQLSGKCSFHGVGTWEEDLDFKTDQTHVRLNAFQDFGLRAVWYGVTGKSGDSPYVGFMSQHSGAWRLVTPAQGEIHWGKDRSVELRLPLNPYMQGEPMNPFSTAEIDPDVPRTLGRRHWGLVLEARPTQEDGKFDTAPHYLYRRYHGSISLNDYKDWVLEWPDRKLSYPRVLGDKKSLARLKANVEKCPDPDALKSHYLINGDTKSIESTLRRVRVVSKNRLNGFNCYVPHFRQFQNDYELISLIDTVLAWPDLPAEDRKILRARMAIMAYKLTNANYLPRGAGVHLGNPNMAINRTLGITLYGRMLGDHPMARQWLDDAYEYLKWSISHDVTAAGGQFRECPGYATYGPMVFIAIAANAMRDAGYDIDRFAPLKEMAQWYIDVATAPTTPRGWQGNKYFKDRFDRYVNDKLVRVLPGLGNGRDIPRGQVSMLLANVFAKSDPKFASQLMGVFQAMGGFLGTEATRDTMWFFWNPDIRPEAPSYRDSVITGFGGVLRAHPGNEEINVQLRQGYVQSHWNPDQGTFMLYARGRCLAPPTGWVYDSAPEGMYRDSLIAFGSEFAGHEHGRVDTLIRDYGFLPSLGYLDGVQTYVRNEGKLLSSPFDWHRQTLLVRNKKVTSPNYVLLRDTMHGDNLLPSWWYQWLHTKAESIKPIKNGLRAAFPDNVMMDILFLHDKNVKASVKNGEFRSFVGEDYCQLRLTRPAGKDYCVLMYPYKSGEPAPRSAEQLAPGVVRVKTAESEDYLFASAVDPIQWAGHSIAFHGYAGMVRIKGGQVELVNATSRNATIRYKGKEQSGAGPWEVKVQGNSVTSVAKAPSRRQPSKPKGNTVIAIETDEPVEDPKVLANGIQGWVAINGDAVTLTASAGLGCIGYGDFYVEGEAPFTATWKPGEITLDAKGRRRVFLMPIPRNLLPEEDLPKKEDVPDFIYENMTTNGWLNWPVAPAIEIDGYLTQAGWYNGLMAVGLDEKASKATIRPYTNPSVWRENATTRLLPIGK